MIRLIPRETKFFRMFSEVSQNVTEGARLLQDILKSPANMGNRLDRLQEIEHRGDDMTHSIITTLNQTFITPCDREDIHRLTSSLDDVLDFVNSAGVRLRLYRIEAPPLAAAEVAGVIVHACAAIGCRRVGGINRAAVRRVGQGSVAAGAQSACTGALRRGPSLGK